MKAKKQHPFIALCALAVFAAAGVSLTAHAQCNIYMRTNQQAIDGYGFSSAWCGTLTTAKNNALYNTLGMSLLRVRIDDGNNWGDEIANTAAAHAAGVKVFGTAWFGPGQWRGTRPNSSGDPQDYLLHEYYADYAQWLSKAATTHNLDWVSPANEPDLGWMAWTSDELRTWIGQYGGSLGTPMLAPESCWFSDDFGDPMLNDPVAGPNISVYGGHYYGNGPRVHQNALDKGKHVWMTEFYIDGMDDINTCMNIAQQINDSMNCQMSAYVWWWANDWDTNVNLVASDGSIHKNGYTMGQFAKWVRPGATRVTANYNPSAGVSVTAYNVNGSAVIVAVNINTYSVNQTFNLYNGNGTPLAGYRTSTNENLAYIGSFAGSSFTANLPARSITTFAQTNGTPLNLPPPWTAQDIGLVGVIGSSTYTNSVGTNGVFTVAASGNDIWNTSDAFRFVYETNGGNCTIIARVSSEQSPNANAKAGVMIRDNLNPGAANVFIGVTRSNGVSFQYRSSTGGGCVSNRVAGVSAPYWVKLEQSGSTVTGYYSANGTSWTQLGTTTISLGSMQTNAWGQTNGPVQYAGLAFCNNGNASLGTAAFDNVSAPGWPIPAPSVPTGLTATAGIERVTLNWQAASYATNYIIKRATVSGGPYTTIATSWRGTRYLDPGLVGGTTYYYVVMAANSAGQSTNSAQVSATPTANVPSPWLAQDIGAVGVVGSEGFTNGVFTVTGSGNDIWDTADAFRYVYKTVTGNCTNIARVTSIEDVDGWAKAGIMIRASLASDAANVFIGVTPTNSSGGGNGVAWQTRSSTGGGTGNATTSDLSAPYWVKLVRIGNTFTGYRSPDGTNWTQQGTATITMSSTVYVGMAVTAHNNGRLCAVTFDNVTMPGWPPPVPPTPTGLVVAGGMEHATLNWLVSSNATSYNVKRSTTNGGPYAIVATVATTNCTDSGLISGTTYYYVVSAVNFGGESANSGQASATPTTASKLSGTIIGTAGSWDGSSTIAKVFDNNLTTYFDAPNGNGAWVGLDFGAGVSNVITRINYCPRSTLESRMTNGIFQGANQANFSDAVTLFTITNQPATGVFTSATNNNASAFRYVRYLSPNDGFGNVAELQFYGYQSLISTAVPSAPPGLVATAISSGQINLNWNAVTNAASYNVKRSTTNGGPYAVIATGVTATNWNDTGLAGGTTYRYVVSAVNSGGESTNSAQASATTPAGATSLQPVSGFGTFTPSTGAGPIGMYVYVPANVVSNPPILVEMHQCGGTAPGVFGWAGGLAAAADQYGFIVVVPEARDTSGNPRCWDPGSTESLTRYGGGDTEAIVSMVNYAAANYHANTNRVYLVGVSSGGMMTEALLAVYPDVFTAGSEFSGIPAGADGWGGNQMSLTPQQWGDKVRAMYPGYSGYRPRIQLWHGTADDIVSYNNQPEAIRQWSNVLGLSTNANHAETVTILGITNQWTHQVWENACGNTILEDWSEIGGGHNTDAAWNAQYVIPFLCLDQTGATDPVVAGCGAPTGLSAQAVSPTQVNLTWNALVGATSYNVKRSLTNGDPYTTIASGVATTNFNDASLAGGTIYYYVVSAVNAGGESPNSAQATATTWSGSLGSLVHRYSFSETNGASIADSVGGPIWNGTLPSGGTLTNGQLTLASASSQYAQLPTGIVGTLSNFTIVTWVKLNSTANWARIFDFGSDGTTNMFLTPQNGEDGRLRFAITTNGGGSEQKINCNSTMSVGVWYQVAVTLNGNKGILYLNGLPVGTNYAMTLRPSILGSTANNYIGRSQYPDPYLDGSIDEFRIYNVGLSAAEVAQFYVGGPSQTATVTLGNLSQTYDGTARSATATTAPTNLTVNLTYNGTANAPTNAGSYTVIGTISDVNYQGSATNTLVISKGASTVVLGNLSQTYNGTAKSATATTTPSGLTVNFTYNGSVNAPTNAGSYTVIGTINNANYQGSATNSLVINKGAGTVTLGSLSQTYDGTVKSASATTTPSGLTVNRTYDGSANAPTNAGSYKVIGTINDANYQGSATNTLVINKGAGTVTLGNLSQTYDGTAKSVTATTIPTNLTVNLTYDGSANAPTNASSYTVIGTINNANYQGSATNTLVISKGAGTVTLDSLSQTYDGTAKSASATTTPTNLTVNLTYNGSANAPTNAGSYTVIGTINDANYQGSATNTLVISKGAGTVALGNLSQTYDGTARSASATTTPSGLTVNLTYNGSANAPTNAGSYTVIGTITDANYQGSATNTLVINDATPPQLSLTLVGANLTVSWPQTNTGFTLQSRTNLVLGNWLNVTSPVAQIVGSNWQVALPRAYNLNAVFYRLSK